QTLLDEAWQLAKRTAEMQRIIPVARARAEAAWLRGDLQSAAEDLRDTLAGVDHFGGTIDQQELELWLWRVGARDTPRPPLPPSSDPYDEALALSDVGDVDAL